MNLFVLILPLLGASLILRAQNSLPSNGNVGIGTTVPQAALHISTPGSLVNNPYQYTGNLIIQGNSGGRNFAAGASLEFVIPANTDGTNPWGQGRIITVAGNDQSSSATGKMIFGTRRAFDKQTGSGYGWNYGDDIVIDGSGNVGIGTSDPKGYKLAVNGSVIATSITVKTYGNWPDYVFDSTYALQSLNEIEKFIQLNKHLPGIPSAKDVKSYGFELADMQSMLLKKQEELTLHLIDKSKIIERLENENKLLKEEQIRMRILLNQISESLKTRTLSR